MNNHIPLFLDKAIIAAARRRIRVVSRLKDPRYTFMKNLIKESDNGQKANSVRTNTDKETEEQENSGTEIT